MRGRPRHSMTSGGRGGAAKLLLILATVAALAVVPDWPHRHLDDPSYWAVAGFVVLVISLLGTPRTGWKPGGSTRRTVVAFLAVVQLVYVASWLRFGGSDVELALQLGGAVAWLIAAFAARTTDTVLWVGCVVHALWDAGHFGRVGFIPEWYAAACIAADVGLGAFVLLELRQAAVSGGRTSA